MRGVFGVVDGDDIRAVRICERSSHDEPIDETNRLLLDLLDERGDLDAVAAKWLAKAIGEPMDRAGVDAAEGISWFALLDVNARILRIGLDGTWEPESTFQIGADGRCTPPMVEKPRSFQHTVSEAFEAWEGDTADDRSKRTALVRAIGRDRELADRIESWLVERIDQVAWRAREPDTDEVALRARLRLPEPQLPTDDSLHLGSPFEREWRYAFWLFRVGPHRLGVPVPGRSDGFGRCDLSRNDGAWAAFDGEFPDALSRRFIAPVHAEWFGGHWVLPEGTTRPLCTQVVVPDGQVRDASTEIELYRGRWFAPNCVVGDEIQSWSTRRAPSVVGAMLMWLRAIRVPGGVEE